MKNIQLAFAKPVLNLMPQLAGDNIEYTDTISKVSIISAKGACGEALEVSPMQLESREGLNWRLFGSGEIVGYGKFSIEVDTQTGVSKLVGQPELNDLFLVIGVEAENLNMRRV
jgi:hypothetical protein